MNTLFGMLVSILPMMTWPAVAGAMPVDTRVVVQSGALDGVIEGDVARWRGIPYAAPPTGANRWRPPQPIRWTGVRKADHYGADCFQKPFPMGAESIRTPPSEDCLFLNVWRPAAATKSKLPVLVWIHGGAFVVGGSSTPLYAGDGFARDGILFVSFNYRLGRFGFFAHPALSAEQPAAPLGNYAYMDQLAALRWVKNNIARFGGDPANVTIFGESAGGAMALGLLASPAAKGLFARVAVSSGGGRDGFRRPPPLRGDDLATPSAERIGLSFAQHQGISGTDAAALRALRALPPDRVLGELDMMALDSSSEGADATFTRGPITDGTIVTGTVGEMLATGAGNRVPLLIGSNGADGCCATGTTMEAYFAPFGPRAAAAQQAYQAHVDQAGTSGPSIGNAVTRDFNQTEPARYLAGAASALGPKSYYYRFTYVAPAMRSTWHGAPHGTDLPFFFDKTELRFGPDRTGTDAGVARAMHGYLVNFARMGDPNGSGLARWDPVRSGDGMVMRFGMDGQAHYGADSWKPVLDLVQASR